jgi:hypothetical protein
MSEPQRIWHFHVCGERIAPDRYRVTLTTASGKVFVREGWHPLYELLRILGKDAKEQPDGLQNL